MNRRNFLRIGGSSLCGVSMLDLLRARGQASDAGRTTRPRATQMICVWMAGGPPHTDMFDMKPDSPAEYRGEFRPIRTNVPGLDICELMPRLAQMADKYTVIRSVTTMNQPGDHSRAPMYWLTGNPRLPSGTPEYPMYGSAAAMLRRGPAELPPFAVLGKIDHHIGNAIATSFLGPAYHPFIFDPLESRDDLARMLTPQVELPSFRRDVDLLRAIDGRLRRQDTLDPLVAGLDRYQQNALDMLRSPKLREALDLSKEPRRVIERYTAGDLPQNRRRYPSGDTRHFLLSRRLIEAGVPIVHFSYGYWDWHGDNFIAGRQQIPTFDVAMSALLQDLDDRGLLDTTIVLALGEMGRKPQVGGTDAHAGRDHWDYAQFVLAAGGGFRRGAVVGATDRRGEHVTDKFYKIESFGRTLYHLLGVDPDTTVTTLANRPMKLIVEETPIIREAIV
ncbi:MAG TPA: DUF1501 domain-containing protein [Gemmataceae bacterium]|jgi:hypothetical protein|nr:DUF1501 domain-containing protein [Gemmataceae bacterium]